MKKIVLLIFLTLNLIALTTNPKIKIPQANSCNIEDNCIDFSRRYSDDEYKRLFGIYKSECELKNLDACIYLAEFYKSGLGVKKDMAKSIEILNKACDESNKFACHNLGVEYQEMKDHKMALESFK